MSVTDEIRDKLLSALEPDILDVVDESEKHRGHAGYQEGGESHFHVTIVAENFNGLSRLERHRAVHEALGPDLIGRIHALGLTLKAPE